MKKDLSIIIVTYNSSVVINTCLKELDTKKYDVFVVDNASSDNTVKIVEEKYPKVKLTKLDKNIGYGRANNIGLRQTKTDFALILNPDALIKVKDIEIVLDAMRNQKNIALATPLLVTTNKINSTVKEDIILLKETLAKTKEKYQKKYYLSDFVAGAALFMRMEIFRKIGFFDEEIFMFTEDNIICENAVKNGYNNIIIPQALALHIGGGSSKKTLAVIYRRFWHLGWAKSRYKVIRKSKFGVIRASLRLICKHFLQSFIYLLSFNFQKSVAKIAFTNGCFSYLIGLKAFKKDGNPRGNFLWQ